MSDGGKEGPQTCWSPEDGPSAAIGCLLIYILYVLPACQISSPLAPLASLAVVVDSCLPTFNDDLRGGFCKAGHGDHACNSPMKDFGACPRRPDQFLSNPSFD